MEPFVCNYTCTIDLRPVRIFRSRNSKLTSYLSNRKKFNRSFPSRFDAASNYMNADKVWYEFELGTIDGRPILILFQIDEKCKFLCDVPVQGTTKENGRLRACSSAFIKKIVLRAARLLHKNTETAKGGFRYVITM